MVECNPAGFYRTRENGERTEPVISVVRQIAGHCRRQSGAVPHHTRKLPSSNDSIQHPAGIAEEGLVLSDRKLEKIIGADVVPYIEVGRSAKLFRIEDVLYCGTLLARPRFR